MTVLLLHYIHNDQEETRFITYEASLILTTPPPAKWYGITDLTEALTCLWTTAELGVCLPLESWNSWAILPQFGVDCCGHTPHSSILQLGSPYLTYFVLIWVSRKQGGPPFQAEQIPLPKKHHSHLYTRYLCVHVWSLDWKGRKRARQRECCVQSFPSQSRNNFRWGRVRERQISHDIVYLWHLKKWTYLQNRLTENELTATRGDSVRGRLDWKFGTDIYTRL